MTTTYTIHDGPNAPFQTTDADRAEQAARAGAKVTAVTGC